MRRPSLSSRVISLAIASFLLAAASPAEAADPQLGTVLPRGAKAGTQVDIVLYGQRLGDAIDIVFQGEGVTLDSIVPRDDRRVDATITIAPACRIGMHALRVRTSTGVSNLRLFSVGRLEEVREKEPNDTFDTPQTIEPGTTVNGVAADEDVDYYAFEGVAGESIAVELEGMRLGERLFDPFVAVLDSRGFEIASCDDSAFLRQDPFVSVVLPTDGVYRVLVRESSYRGNNACRYRLHVGRFTRPVATMPLGGRPGETLPVTVLGEGPETRSATVELPDRARAEASGGWFPDSAAGVLIDDAPSPNWFRVIDLDNVIEAEPNNGHAGAQPITVPAAINGVVGDVNDHDCFVFNATKDQAFEIAVFARRLRTPLDAVVTVHRRGAARIGANDDDGGPDSRLDFTAPEDGEYVITIRDHLRRGGDAFAYRIEVAPPLARVSLQTPRRRQHVVVPQGGRTAILLTATRTAFGGPLLVEARDLPAGVSTAIAPVSGRVSAVPVVFESTPETPLGHALVDVAVRHADAERNINGHYRQDVELILGRNNVVFQAHTVDRLPVAVVDRVPFAIDVEPPGGPLVRNGSTQLVVRATRDEGFTEPIRLAVPFAPPGLGAGRGVTIGPDQTESRVPINANGNAPLESWSVVVTAEANAPGGGVFRVSSALVPLTVAAPWVAFAPQGTTVEQGQSTTMAIEITKQVEFEGTATVELHGLPHHVLAEPVEIDAAATMLSFAVTTQADSPPGRHKNLFCIARFTLDDAPVVHRLPAGELRIDKPLPVVAQAAAPPPAPPATTERPPTRLEKLRREHEERRRREAEQRDAENGGDR